MRRKTERQNGAGCARSWPPRSRGPWPDACLRPRRQRRIRVSRSTLALPRRKPEVLYNRSLVVFGVACSAVSRRSLRSFLAERRPKTYRRALYVPLSGGGCKRGLHRYCHHHSLKQGSAWLCVPLSTGGRNRGLHRNCHHHSLKTYSRALPGSASLCPVVVASEASTVIAITIV
ncbi:hypothetical protein ISCGN_009947 [Ixodes scapularis]